GEPDALGGARIRGRWHSRELHRAWRRGDTHRGCDRREQGSGRSQSRTRPARAARRPARRHRLRRALSRGPACGLRHRAHAGGGRRRGFRSGRDVSQARRRASRRRATPALHGTKFRAGVRGRYLPFFFSLTHSTFSGRSRVYFSVVILPVSTWWGCSLFQSWGRSSFFVDITNTSGCSFRHTIAPSLSNYTGLSK